MRCVRWRYRRSGRCATDASFEPGHVHADWQLVHEYPLTPALLAMSQTWRDGSGGLLGVAVLARGFMQGTALLLATLAIFGLALHAGLDEGQARLLGIVALTAGNVSLVAVDATARLGWRSLVGRKFAAFWAVAALASGALAVGMLVPTGRMLLHFGQPPGVAIAMVVAVMLLLAVAIAWVSTPRQRRPS